MPKYIHDCDLLISFSIESDKASFDDVTLAEISKEINETLKRLTIRDHLDNVQCYQTTEE